MSAWEPILRWPLSTAAWRQPAKQPWRKSKEKRMDLRIVGLVLLVTKDFHIPLFHQVYPGNAHDSTTFASVTETLVARYRLFSQSVEGITLVYDKGNNSQDNQAR